MIIHSLSKRKHGGSTYAGSLKLGYLSSSASDLLCHFRTDPQNDFVIKMQTIVNVKYLGPGLKEMHSST